MRLDWYEQRMLDLAPEINPVGAVCLMRLEYGTLDHLPHEVFVREAKIARDCETHQPGTLRATAESYGEAKRYDRWEDHAEANELPRGGSLSGKEIGVYVPTFDPQTGERGNEYFTKRNYLEMRERMYQQVENYNRTYGKTLSRIGVPAWAA